MALDASIFIPDISGYTEFVTRTELEHSSHIINELLKVLVESNATDLTLGEIEGDALLFYRTGAALPFEEMTRQAITMFTNFHSRLKIIERDSICQCGACQTASKLSLKFVLHYGAIQEMRIANFVKASGIDMIIAHRLLKNSLPTKEYVLVTESYLKAVTDRTTMTDLSWSSASEDYGAVGEIAFQYALLDAIRESLPPAPLRQQAEVRLDDRTVQIEFASPMIDVYQMLIDFNGRKLWIEGLKSGDSEQPVDRLSAKHFCYFDDYTVQIVPLDRVISDDSIRYAEEFSIPERGLKGIAEFIFEKLGPRRTRLTGRVGTQEGGELSPEAAQGVLAQTKENLERMKELLEKGAA
ncbi:MAG: DUF2652 domain-containing protein [Betaproteobacteria bacterium]|nr:MAG: DUF2652 domain-containing protein [Betaproteobacteria bacterium]